MARTASQSKRQAAKEEAPLSAVLPFSYHHDSETIGLKHQAFMQVIKVQGLPASTINDELLVDAHNKRNRLLIDVADTALTLYTHSIKRKVSLSSPGEFTNGFSTHLNGAWNDKLQAENLYATEHYITPVMDCYVGAQKQVKGFFRSLAPGSFESELRNVKAATLKKLHKTTNKIATRLGEKYHARLLGVEKWNDRPISEPLSFLGYLVNAEYKMLALPDMDVSRYLSNSRVLFGGEMFEIRTATGTKYGTVFSIKEYPAKTPNGMLDPLFALKRDLIVTQAFSYLSKPKTKKLIEQERITLSQSDDCSISQLEQLEEALDNVDSGLFRMGQYHCSVVCLADSTAELMEAVGEVDTALSDVNIAPVREDLNTENVFLAQMPGNLRFACRRRPITTMNFAGLSSLHGESIGRAKFNKWGDAIAVLPTDTGSPYYFNFHVGRELLEDNDDDDGGTDKAATLITGVNGSGKTLAMNFLLTQAQKVKHRLIYFDRDSASEIFVRALGGQYSTITPDLRSGFNPLQLPDTNANRVFLEQWFAALLTANGETLNAQERVVIKEAIDGVYSDLQPHHRQLANAASYFMGRGCEDLVLRLSIWHSEGSRAYLFDNPEDNFSLSGDVLGIDMTLLLTDELIQFPVILYVFHQLIESLDGTPTLIPFDEGWAFLKNPYFEANIEELLKTIRKKDGVVIFTTQNPAEMVKSNISASLIDETATHIHFPNDTANKEHYCDKLKLNDKQYQFVRDTEQTERKMLIRQGKQSVIAHLDLAGMEDVIPVLSGTKENVEIMRKLIEQVGEDPKDWLPLFLNEAKG